VFDLNSRQVFNLATWYGLIFPAAWSPILALRSRGYGTTLTTLHLQFESEAAQALDIPYDSVHQAALLPVARYTGDDFKPGRRRPVNEVTYWDGWGASR
jgi:hypothetical protein